MAEGGVQLEAAGAGAVEVQGEFMVEFEFAAQVQIDFERKFEGAVEIQGTLEVQGTRELGPESVGVVERATQRNGSQVRAAGFAAGAIEDANPERRKNAAEIRDH